MTLRRAKPFWAKKKSGGGWSPITDSSFDGFGLERIYNSTTESIEIERSSDNTSDIFNWLDGNYDLSSIDIFLGINNGSIISLFGQKNLSSNILLENTSGLSRPIYIKNGVNTNKPVFRFITNQYLLINGSLSTSLSKNVSYFSVIILCKSNGTISGSNQYLFYISTGSSTQRVRVGVGVLPDPADGFFVAGRRATADSATVISSIHDTTNWSVVTAIFDYINQVLILRINGVQQSINTSFGNGTNSENTNALQRTIGATITTTGHFFGDISGLTIWNGNPTSFSEIEAVENRYMTYAGII